MDSLQQEMLQTQQQLESQKLSLQKRVDAVQAKLELVEAENARRTMSATTPAPQVAWGDTKNEQSSSESPRNLHGENVGSSNQESHDHERTIEKLRLTLAQKERVRHPWHCMLSFELGLADCVDVLASVPKGDIVAAANSASRMSRANVTAGKDAQRQNPT